MSVRRGKMNKLLILYIMKYQYNISPHSWCGAAWIYTKKSNRFCRWLNQQGKQDYKNAINWTEVRCQYNRGKMSPPRTPSTNQDVKGKKGCRNSSVRGPSRWIHQCFIFQLKTSYEQFGTDTHIKSIKVYTTNCHPIATFTVSYICSPGMKEKQSHLTLPIEMSQSIPEVISDKVCFPFCISYYEFTLLNYGF